MKTIVKLDLTLLLHSRPVIVSLLFSAAIFFVIAKGLTDQAEERSSIPIGVVDEDNSQTSQRLLSGLKESGALFLYEKPKEDLEKMLYNETISALFVIKEGFEEGLKAGTPEEAILLQYLSNNSLALAVADIVAGEMMYEVCIGKGIKIYQGLGDQYKIVSPGEYRKSADQIKNNAEFEHGFRIQMTDPKSRKDTESSPDSKLENQLIYQQMIIGMIGIAMSFLILFLVGDIWTGKEHPPTRRLMLSGMPRTSLFFGHGFSILLVLFLYCLVSTVFMKANMGIAEAGSFVSLFLIQMAAGIAYFLIFLLLKTITKGSILYPLAGGIFVVLSGGMGIMGLFWADLLKVSKIIPNYWCIETFTAIIKNTV